jgi:hypothetical protein
VYFIYLWLSLQTNKLAWFADQLAENLIQASLLVCRDGDKELGDIYNIENGSGIRATFSEL